MESNLIKGIKDFLDNYKERNICASKNRNFNANQNSGQRIYQIDKISNDEESRSSAEKLEDTNGEEEFKAILSELLSEPNMK